MKNRVQTSPQQTALFFFVEEIDNIVWSGTEREIIQWCMMNKVYYSIAEAEIEEIWKRESPDDEEPSD